jgi:hypothetical protein
MKPGGSVPVVDVTLRVQSVPGLWLDPRPFQLAAALPAQPD